MDNRYGFHLIYERKYSDWNDLEESIKRLPTTKEIGDAFEQFCFFYLMYFKDYYQINDVWCNSVKTREIPSNIREKYKFRDTDYGVDGVCLLADERLEAWQAKFRSDRSSPSVRELSTFWAEADLLWKM